LVVSLSISAVIQLLVVAAGSKAITMGIMCFLQNATTMSVWAVLFAYTPEVYPTTLRTRGLGAANMLDRVGGIIGPYVGGVLVANNKTYALILFSIAVALAAVASWFLDIETKGQPLADRLDDDDDEDEGVDQGSYQEAVDDDWDAKGLVPAQ
jgi:putative MFS transporter